VKIGQERSLRLVPLLHALALGAFAVFGWLNHWGLVFNGVLILMAIVTAVADLRLFRRPEDARIPFQFHFLLSALFLVGTAAAVFGR
jgi:hypothetical protein